MQVNSRAGLLHLRLFPLPLALQIVVCFDCILSACQGSVLKTSCVWIAALASMFGFDMGQSFPGRRVKKMRERMLKPSVLEMSFLLGQRCTRG